MRVIKINSTLTGVPDYYDLYLRWLNRYYKDGDNKSKVLAYHYARVAEEMGQVEIDEDITLDM